jgi:dolichyl-phosphate-mannose--protein O-mannosyl transferase
MLAHSAAAYDPRVSSAGSAQLDTDAGGGVAVLDRPEPAAPRQPALTDVGRRRLTPMAHFEGRSWAATFAVVLVAAILRLTHLALPKGKIFDEIYYATEGHELFQHGVEWRPSDVPGQPGNGDFVVHPPLGKWLIGLGEQVFGYNEFGWRIAAAIAGILSVLIITRLARRMFGSTVLGCAAGLLMALDGMHFVLSRSALLDIFLMLFILAAFACLVWDRDARRKRWLTAIENGMDATSRTAASRPHGNWGLGPTYRVLAAVFTGCACGVKWSAIWFIPLFLILMVAWSYGLRRTVGAARPISDTVLAEAGWVAGFIGIAFAVYLSTWTGWFMTDHGWDRHWTANQQALHGQRPHEIPIYSALRNLLHYHHEMLNFHEHLDTKHTYQSWPWQWLLLGRPVAFYWSGDGPCGGPQCASEVLLLGTPLLWWSFIPALIGLAWLTISRRDWRGWAILLAVFCGIVPWFKYEMDDRTMFYFYALPAEPFLILAVVYVLGALVRPATVRSGFRTETGPSAWYEPRIVGSFIFGLYMAMIAWCFYYFYPIYTGAHTTYQEWFQRMWLGNRWI